MAGVSLGISEARFEAVRRALAHIPGGAEKAVARALNSAASYAYYEASHQVAKRYTLPPDLIRKQLQLIRASPKYLKATITSRGQRIEVAKFERDPLNPPRQKSIPVRLRQRITTTIVAGQTKGWSHAFLARMGSGHVGLWTRSKTERTANGKPVIHEFFTLAPPQMMSAAPILNRVLDVAQSRLEQEIDVETRILLRAYERGEKI